METQVKLVDPERLARLVHMGDKVRRGLVMRCHMDGAEALEAVNEACGGTKPLEERETDLAWLANRWGLTDLLNDEGTPIDGAPAAPRPRSVAEEQRINELEMWGPQGRPSW